MGFTEWRPLAGRDSDHPLQGEKTAVQRGDINFPRPCDKEAAGLAVEPRPLQDLGAAPTALAFCML